MFFPMTESQIQLWIPPMMLTVLWVTRLIPEKLLLVNRVGPIT